MNIKINTLVTFTAEEKQALELIGSIDCTGINCALCPFNSDDQNYCVKVKLRSILHDAEDAEALDND